MSFRQFIKLFTRYNTVTIPKRLVHDTSKQYSRLLVPLTNRSLLKVTGQDAPEFLQGLITNDMRHFEDGAKIMYALFLNQKGRVLYDTLIYKWKDDDSFLIECDKSISSTLQKHLKIYKLKQLVTIEDMNKICLWALISSEKVSAQTELNSENCIDIYRDPRLKELGCRILSMPGIKATDISKKLCTEQEVQLGDEGVYKCLRYKLGVGEGSEDLPPGACFPLEVNCDYLHGVSFHKGCYVGQEFTARVHHTGVVRKRLMPIIFHNVITNMEKDAVIRTPKNPKSNLGKLKGFIHNHGLGLVRIKEALEAKTLMIGDQTADIVKPSWWPLEAPKEKITNKPE